MVYCQVAKRLQQTGTALALAAAVGLGGCSWVPNAVNPISWYRNLSGASKNDALDKNQPNQQNLDAGSKQPYPNLADVPDAPDQALSTAERDKLQQSLVADRQNARYSADRLEAGAPVVGAVAPPPPPGTPAAVAIAPQRPAAQRPAAQRPAAQPAQAVPRESALVSPTVHAVPTGETPPPPPPPPSFPGAPAPAAAPVPPVQTASLDAGRRGAATSSVEVGQVSFADGSTTLSDEAKTKLSEIAAMQHQKGGALRIIGHAKPPSAISPMQQKLDSLALALARAKAVAQELGTEGVPPSALAVEAATAQADDTVSASAQVFLEH